MHEQTLKRDYEVCKLHETRALATARGAVESLFPFEDEEFRSATEFHARVATAQDLINQRGVGASIAWQLRDDLRRLLGPGQLMIQAGMFLRAARPDNDSEVIGWHRESMYGGSQGTWNVWVPLVGVDAKNALRYIPGSADIPDDDLIVTADHEGAVERGSDSQRIGLLYAPKKIVRGVDLLHSEPMLVPLGNAAVFPGSLIHGAGVNSGRKIRFSLDMRVIAQRNLA